MEQQFAVVVSSGGILLVAAVFLWVALKAGSGGDGEAVGRAVTSIRSRTFWSLAVVAALSIAISLFHLPYAAGAAELRTATVVEVIGSQWRWEMSRSTVPLGEPIEFRVSATDVNHGFAIYDEALAVQAQVQAMPGYTNVLRHTFTKPGVYKLLCLEYCGVAHHVMAAELTVR
jgi:cytochrome c oxidase subunit 2